MATKTRPDIKWLLVERATLVGDIDQLARRRAMLDAEMERLRAQVQALDMSIRLLDARVRAAAAGTVFRHCQQYGRRGALKAFIVQAVGNAEQPLLMRDIASLAAAHFGLEFLTKAEFTRYCRNSIRPQLQLLREEGVFEGLQDNGAAAMVLWRWKRALPALADLALLSSQDRHEVSTQNCAKADDEPGETTPWR